MYYVYVLKSCKNSSQYIGFTEKFPHQRLHEHNYRSSTYTRNNGPYKLIYCEEHSEKVVAQKRELFLKSGNGRRFLKKKLADAV